MNTRNVGVLIVLTLLTACTRGGGGDDTPATPASYAVGGAVSGLASGQSVALQNNGGDDLALSANGTFRFATSVVSGSAYSVTVLTQPNGQICTVNNGAGVVDGADVADVTVSCVSTYVVGGNVAGLGSEKYVVLQNNGSDDISVFADGTVKVTVQVPVSFQFRTPVADGSAYSVTVLTQPEGQTCKIDNATGSVNGADVTDVAVTCTTNPPTAPSLGVGYGVKQVKFGWAAVSGAAYYKLKEDPDGVSDYNQIGGDLTVTSYDHAITLHRRLNASYIVEACNGAGCTPSTPVSLASNLVPAIGYIKASNTEAQDYFGSAVALSADGTTLAVGASWEDSNATGVDGDQTNNSASVAGAVYVFKRGIDGAWTQQAYVKASNTDGDTGNSEIGDQFGSALSISADGNTLVVGAPGEAGNGGSETDNSATGAGAAYVFVRSGEVWSQQRYLKASNVGASDAFGLSVALSADGNTLAVGAPGEDSVANGIDGNQSDDTLADSGAVYVFARNGNTWSSPVYVKASNPGAGDAFGDSVAISADGNTLAVGADFESSDATGIGGDQNNDNAVSSGAVYVLVRSAGAWSQQAYVKASNTGGGETGGEMGVSHGDRFGYSVALSHDGNTLAVGAPNEDSKATGVAGDQADNTAANAGAAYMFVRAGTVWSQQAYIKASNTGAGDGFGLTVALSGDGNVLAVGAPFEAGNASGIGGNQADNSAAIAGATYVLSRAGEAWSPLAYVKASNTGAGDFHGAAISLSVDGGTLAIGATGEASSAVGVNGDQTNDSAAYAGAVYLY